MKAKKVLILHFPSRSRAAFLAPPHTFARPHTFLARPDTLHGVRGKYDPAKGIRQENRRGHQSKPRSPDRTFWPPEPFWDWVAIHTTGWCVAGERLPAPYCRASPRGASVPRSALLRTLAIHAPANAAPRPLARLDEYPHCGTQLSRPMLKVRGRRGPKKKNQVPFLRSGSSSIGGGNTRQSMPRAFPGQIGPA
jgi:hypothetical protein